MLEPYTSSQIKSKPRKQDGRRGKADPESVPERGSWARKGGGRGGGGGRRRRRRRKKRKRVRRGFDKGRIVSAPPDDGAAECTRAQGQANSPVSGAILTRS